MKHENIFDTSIFWCYYCVIYVKLMHPITKSYILVTWYMMWHDTCNMCHVLPPQLRPPFHPTWRHYPSSRLWPSWRVMTMFRPLTCIRPRLLVKHNSKHYTTTAVRPYRQGGSIAATWRCIDHFLMLYNLPFYYYYCCCCYRCYSCTSARLLPH